MDNNTILRKLRFTYDFEDSEMISIFESGGRKTNRAEVSNWMKPEDEEEFTSLFDVDLAAFLNGFIILKRGKKEGAETPKPEKSLSNNLMLRKLKIALNLKDVDMIDVLKKANFNFGKSELNSFFRKEGHPKFRKCHDQVLRNFLQGLQNIHRPEVDKFNKETYIDLKKENKK